MVYVSDETSFRLAVANLARISRVRDCSALGIRLKAAVVQWGSWRDQILAVIRGQRLEMFVFLTEEQWLIIMDCVMV